MQEEALALMADVDGDDFRGGETTHNYQTLK